MSLRWARWEIRCDLPDCAGFIAGDIDIAELHPAEAAEREAALAGWGVGWAQHHCPEHVALAVVAALTSRGTPDFTPPHMTTHQNEVPRDIHRPDSP